MHHNPFLLSFLTAFLFLIAAPVHAAPSDVSVLVLKIQGSINPAQEDVLQEAIEYGVKEQTDLLVIQLDTPGGLGETTRNMVKKILNAPLPVAIWVGPDGSRAASAGVFLVAASNVAGMSPHSNIGSARPVGMGGEDIPEAMAEKIVNDFLSLIRATAQSRNRNVEWYISAVTESANLTGTEAVMNRVIDFVASDLDDFVEQIGVRGLEWNNTVHHFTLDQASLIFFEPGLWYAILSWLLDPQIAYFLLMGGLAGLFFELTNPGAIFPGVFGGLCLLLGLYALSILPTNVAGLLLILFGLMLFALEVMITSFGLLSIAGAVAVFFGSVILFRFEYGVGSVPMTSIFVTTIALSAFTVLCVYLVAKAHRSRPVQGEHSLLGQKGVVRQWSATAGLVHVQGETWSAVSQHALNLNSGDRVYIQSVDGLVLTVHTQQPS
jgi:membrane-bound serine protease (ClpP class)